MPKILLMLAALALPAVGSAAQLKPGAPTVLITGANRGIGLELARQYAGQGWNVIATSRRAPDDPGLAELRAIAAKHPQVAIERIDVTDSQMIRSVSEKYRDQPIDVLINNAANVEETLAADMEVLTTPFEKINFDDARRDFDVNTLGPMRMAQAFLPQIKQSKQKKIVNVSSLAGGFAQSLPGWMGMNYGASKAALNKYSVLLSNALREEGIIVALVQPIMVASKKDMKDHERASPVDVEVAKLIKEIDKMTLEKSSGKITNFTTGRIDPF